MIKLEIGPLSLVDGQFWTFAITLWCLRFGMVANGCSLNSKSSSD